MKHSVIVDVTLRIVVLSTVVLSVYLLGAGHNQPGGGFIGGLVGAAGIALLFVAGGLDAVRRTVPVRPWTVLGGGLVVAVAAAIAPLLGGGAVLEQGFHTLDLPLAGKVKITSALVFDTGVFFVVLGMVLMAFEALGEEEAPPEAAS